MAKSTVAISKQLIPLIPPFLVGFVFAMLCVKGVHNGGNVEPSIAMGSVQTGMRARNMQSGLSSFRLPARQDMRQPPQQIMAQSPQDINRWRARVVELAAGISLLAVFGDENSRGRKWLAGKPNPKLNYGGTAKSAPPPSPAAAPAAKEEVAEEAK
eukprot:gnl/TRDRNA2_/TRDRNA2_168099_c1_seq1.p1 gnl/TRDRNA2_/TRDRNA2_168099_c1~~gnl/TRDRNA2_/TRDRNA2_168099_c1_seq1.p1  ORF type:complete len:156 (+),score=23.60 gnl/TRDRNA2_/TRDRNA2_168099_c1_seq1:74-541(+)